MDGAPNESLVVVAGHICLDVIPSFDASAGGLDALRVPGSLLEVGPPVLSTGGAVSNTGLALHRLGIRTRLVGQVGDDFFGHAILDLLRDADPTLAEGMVVNPAATSSYTIVLNPPGVDRVFLHSPGANDAFAPGDVPPDRLVGARIFHFGYPPLMRATHADGGTHLAALFARLQTAGTLTSLDMALPDPETPAGRFDWVAWLETVLPSVDFFCPSLDETLFMLDRPRYDRLSTGPSGGAVDGALLSDLAGRLLEWGAAAVGLKLGTDGLYVRTSTEAERLRRFGQAPSWRGCELLAPCYRVEAAGTTGAGDATIAGLLAAVARNARPPEAVLAAVGVGACSVERPDAVSGIPPWPDVQHRMRAGWPQREVGLALPGWRRDPETGLHVGPADAWRIEDRG